MEKLEQIKKEYLQTFFPDIVDLEEGTLSYEMWKFIESKVCQLEPPVKPDACEHNYQIAKKDYYKPTGQIGALGVMTYNQERTYSTLFCTKCGETKEIITS